MNTSGLYVLLSTIFTIGFIVILAIILINKKSHRTGESGEYKISKLINRIKEEDELLFNNFLAGRNKYNTESIQIDHIFISHKGIFVIETKDYRGRIYGDLNQTYWTQVLAYGNVKNKLYNPIKQNETHVNYVYKLLGEKYRVFSAVIFLGADRIEVTNALSLFTPSSFTRWYQSRPIDERMTKTNIIKAYNTLVAQMQKYPITKQEHINNIKRKHG